MLYRIYSIFGRLSSDSLWHSTAPIRGELFGLERLEEHAISLAKAQDVSNSKPIVLPLHERLDENAKILLNSYHDSAAELERGESIVPAAEWLLDNYHLVEAQIREVRDALPVGYYRQLPKLADGLFAGYPRVFGLAWAYVAHTDSHLDPEILIRFVKAYQKIQPLTIGELWAVAITLRVVLIENLRRLADQISIGRVERADAVQLTKRLLVADCAHSALQEDIASRPSAPLSEDFAAQLAKCLRDQDPQTTPALDWLEQRLKAQGLTVEEVVQHTQQQQGASNVSIRNIISSMRLISDIDWADLFEQVSLVDKELRLESQYADMDFPTHNLYRQAIEQLARGSTVSEVDIAKQAMKAAKESVDRQRHTSVSAEDSQSTANEIEAQQIEIRRLGDPGYYLIGLGRLDFEQSIHYKPSIGQRILRQHKRLGVGGYSGSIAIVALGLLAIALLFPHFFKLSANEWLLWFVIGFIPASEVASAIVNRLISWRFGAITLPGLELKSGVPASLRTLIVIPTLLTSEADLIEQIERLEVHYLSGIYGDVYFALLTDGIDAEQEELPGDAPLLARASIDIDALNTRYSAGSSGKRFLLLHRRRLYNASEHSWMGWERKRGKLTELNQLLRGATDTSFIAVNGQRPNVPSDVRYVITLDGDTRLPRGAALRLIGKMAHPLNKPRFDVDKQRVVEGYAILQPRVTPSLSIGSEGSLYQRIFSSPGGLDPYATATSDVYQDLFDEGSYTGKGIYDVDLFSMALAGRVTDNTLLSHDLFEGIFSRAGLVSDVEVIEEFPARYDVAVKRQHRWIRGDWQLLPWVLGHWSDPRGVTCIGRWKLLDNLRRSLLAPMTLLALLLCWLLLPSVAFLLTALLLATIAIPVLIPCLFSIIPHHSGIDHRHNFRLWLGDLRLAFSQTLLTIVFLPDQSFRNLDAIGRTLIRLWVTHQHLLEWTTAAHCNSSPRLSLMGFYLSMLGGVLLGLFTCAIAFIANITAWPLILSFALLWICAPILALYASRSPVAIKLDDLGVSGDSLRLTARSTWRYFETFVTPAENMLPPDNFQEDPEPAIAHRTSPTNIGLYLLSAAVARDFGWAGLLETIERLEATFLTLKQLPKYKGHLFNWYDTQTLQSLQPEYISSVDSGNMAGHLIALANSCEEWLEQPMASNVRCGLLDNVSLISQAIAIGAIPKANLSAKGQANLSHEQNRESEQLLAIVDNVSAQLNSEQSIDTMAITLLKQTEQAANFARDLSPIPAKNRLDSIAIDYPANVIFWIEATQKRLLEQERDRLTYLNTPEILATRLKAIAQSARTMALAMNFNFLIDPERKLLSIGFSLSENSLDPSCYDLLASEARLASLFAIAKGDADTKHWFHLGRTATPIGNGSALISWSGSMFEYLMPSLVMRAPAGSLLEQTNRLVVQRQQEYGRHLGIPWGVSESAYNARDIEFTYQYSNFGVPGLGLKRGLAENKVISPYATGLATMVAPHAAVANFNRLAELGASGSFGFYEALDYTPSRLPLNSDFAIVRSYMAHHQGMTIVAIANTLYEGLIRRRFHREPMIQACELLLQERMPRDVSISHPRAEEVKVSASRLTMNAPTVRSLNPAADGTPVTHLLSNGRYAVMLTATGAGYSRWRDIAITRWQEDTTCDPYGSFIFLRDVETGQRWSNCAQPMGNEGEYLCGVFDEDHAEFVHHDANLTTTTDVLVSGEDDGEVRRISLSNNGSKARDIELTSYVELVLSPPATDNAHPAFAKMFVQTEHVTEYGALIATRRMRSKQESPVWAAHFAIVEGDVLAEPQYETNRALFIGRGNSIRTAAAFDHSNPNLSNTLGTVLDPIFSLRYRLRVPAGGVARVAFWTMVASSQSELMGLIDKHHDRNAYDRAKTLAWTQAQVQLRHLNISSAEAADFQRLAAPILYADPRFRAPAQAIYCGMACQSTLWTLAVGGDLPIVLLHIDDVEDIKQVKQLLRAHEYWHMKQLDVDLVIINEHAGSYLQDLQVAIETAVRSSQSRPRLADEFHAAQQKGTVHMLRADLMTAQTRNLLKSVARVILIARRGSIGKQISRLPPAASWNRTPRVCSQTTNIDMSPSQHAELSSIKQQLEFFNGYGGFSDNGREYTIILENGTPTPAPWINVIANPNFGFHVAAEGSAFTWAENSRENQLTPWCNDPVANPSGEAIYIRDEDTLALYSATAQPVLNNARHRGTFIAQHGHGYSRFEHQADDLTLTLLQYVPLTDPIKISRLTLHNQSGRRRRFSVTAYIEWVLGTARSASGPLITTELDAGLSAILIRNRWSVAFPDRVAFADMCGLQTSWTTDRTEFLGRNAGINAPAALLSDTPLSGVVGAGHDPCTAQQCILELGPNESTEVVILMGQCTSAQKALELITYYRSADLDLVLDEVKQHWQQLLGAVQVKTPDRAMDIMLNGWLLYQTVACRLWARSAFYQASGAFGFRDQLQDGMSLTFRRPELTREHILRAAGRQFVEGDVQHWWLPHTGQGVRTRISDDRVWLAFAVATYIQTSGDSTILDESIPFIDGPPLDAEQHDAFFQALQADESATLFEHCARGLDQCLTLIGEHGLPLIGTGDWNDGMNRVGEAGKGESVWLGWLLIRTITLFSAQANGRNNEERTQRWLADASDIQHAIEEGAWDGEWYRRASFDDGSWLGTKANEECQIDSIAQSWAVLSEAAQPKRAAQAMAAVEQHLISHKQKLALLFTPPFDKTLRDPGYIKGYPPGLRENGGQYSHAAMWSILAYSKLGETEKAHSLFALLNPINHASNIAQAQQYKVEPYVMAADLYSVDPHIGRGGWTWYTGAAGWMHSAGMEGILGINREGLMLTIQPCIPSSWAGFEVTVKVENTDYNIVVKQSTAHAEYRIYAVLDDKEIKAVNEIIRTPLDGKSHQLTVFIELAH